MIPLLVKLVSPLAFVGLHVVRVICFYLCVSTVAFYIRIIIKFECLLKHLGVLRRPHCVSFSGLICAHSLYLIKNLYGIKTSVANTSVLP